MFAKPKYIPQPELAARYMREAAALPGAKLAWLAERRVAAAEHLASMGFPAVTVEGWQFTPVKGRWQETLPEHRAHQGDIRALLEACEPLPEGPRLVLVNGRFNTGLSTLPESAGITFQPLKQWLEASPERAQNVLGASVASGFEEASLALAEDGFVLVVERSNMLELPLVVLHLHTGGEVFGRHLIVLEEGASAEVIEVVAATDGVTSQAVDGLDIHLEKNAKLTHMLALHSVNLAVRLRAQEAVIGEGAALQHFTLDLGGKLSRTETRVTLAGEKADAKLDALVLLGGDAHGETVNQMRHKAENATSHQRCRMVAGGKAHGVFQGCTTVLAGANGTDAHQQNRNLLLSPTARIDAKPELVIDADEVACSHGSATGSIDKQALFYLESRGIPAAEARALLVQAFAAELLESGVPENLQATLQALFTAWMQRELAHG